MERTWASTNRQNAGLHGRAPSWDQCAESTELEEAAARRAVKGARHGELGREVHTQEIRTTRQRKEDQGGGWKKSRGGRLEIFFLFFFLSFFRNS
jgi:hypothetical protein